MRNLAESIWSEKSKARLCPQTLVFLVHSRVQTQAGLPLRGPIMSEEAGTV